MSPIRLWTFTAALITTAVLAAVWIMEGTAHANIVARQVEQLLRMLTVIAWQGLISCICAEAAMAKSTALKRQVEEKLQQAVEEIAGAAATAARLDVLERIGQQPAPRRPRLVDN